MPQIKIYKSPWKAIQLILLSCPFVAISLADILCDLKIWPVWLNWLSLCFFGLGIPIGLFNLLDTRAEMILNEEGIFNRLSYSIFNKKRNRGFVRWESIKDVFLYSYQHRSPHGIPTSKQKFICLTLDAEAIKDLGSKSHKLSKNLGLGDYNIPLMNLKKFDEQKFIELLKTMSVSNFSQKQQLLNEFNHEPK